MSQATPIGSSIAHSLCTTLVRLALVVAAVGIIAIGIFQHPETATTHAELAIGQLLAFAVSLQMLVAALFFPMLTPQRAR